MGYFLYSVELSNLIECIYRRAEAAVQTENLIFNHGSQRQKVEKLSEYFPYISVTVLPQTLIIKTIPKLLLTENVVFTFE